MLYIDPGTGSMLFTILIGMLGAGAYKFKDITVKTRFLLSGGKIKSEKKEDTSFVIFSDHKRYWNVFEPVCDEFERRECKVNFLTASPDDPALEKDYKYVITEFIGEGNKAFAKLNTIRADIVLSTTPSLDVLYWKRSKNVKWYVHIPHAASDLTLYRMFGIDFYDAVLTSGDYHEAQLRALERERGLHEKEIVKVGLTFMDAARKRLTESQMTVRAGQKTVLLAPSWGPSAILSKYGESIIEALLKTNKHIIIRPHPQSFTSESSMIERLLEKYPDSERLEWNRDNDNFDVLKRADIMISDFSGVMFDFCLNFDKPLIYTDVQFDPAPYDACWLDEQPWTFRILPEIGMQLTADNMGEIDLLIDRCLNDSRFKEGRDKAREETWAYIGESAVKTVDYLMSKRDELLREEKEDAQKEN